MSYGLIYPTFKMTGTSTALGGQPSFRSVREIVWSTAIPQSIPQWLKVESGNIELRARRYCVLMADIDLAGDVEIILTGGGIARPSGRSAAKYHVHKHDVPSTETEWNYLEQFAKAPVYTTILWTAAFNATDNTATVASGHLGPFVYGDDMLFYRRSPNTFNLRSTFFEVGRGNIIDTQSGDTKAVIDFGSSTPPATGTYYFELRRRRTAYSSTRFSTVLVLPKDATFKLQTTLLRTPGTVPATLRLLPFARV